MESLWNNPEFEPWASGLLTWLLVPVFYFVVWNPWFTHKRWIHIFTLTSFTYCIYYTLVYLSWNADPSTLRAPASAGTDALSAGYLICQHLRLWFWPFGQDVILRPVEPDKLFRINIFYWLILLLIVRHLIRSRKKNPYVFYGVLWALLTLIPFSGIWPYPGPPLSERHLWFPGLGLALAVASILRLTGQAWTRRFKHLERKVLFLATHTLLSLLLLGVVGELGIRWSQRNDPATRIESALGSAANNIANWAEFARIQARAGNYAEAQHIITRASEQLPWYSEIDVIMAEILYLRQDSTHAAQHLHRASKKNPQNQRIQSLLKLVARTSSLNLPAE